MDQPSIALAMIKILVGGKGLTREGFLTSEQGLANSKKDAAMCALDECPQCKPQMIFENAAELPPPEVQEINMGSVGVLVAAFVSGILITCIIMRKRIKSERNRGQLVSNRSLDNDLELSDMDSYSDKDDAAFT